MEKYTRPSMIPSSSPNGSLNGSGRKTLGSIAKFSTVESIGSRVDSLLRECGVSVDEKLQRRYRFFLQDVAAHVLRIFPKYVKDKLAEDGFKRDGQGRKVLARVKEKDGNPGGVASRFKVCTCCRASLLGGIVRTHVTSKSARYSGMATCASVWTCPVCSSVISVRRRDEIATAVDKASEEGYMVFMMTLTARHHKQMYLGWFYEAMSKAHNRFWSGDDVKFLKARFGIVGMISDREVTFSYENGAHPHIHELVFLRRPVLSDERVNEIKAQVAESVLWFRSPKKRVEVYVQRLEKALKKAQRQLEDEVVREFDSVFRPRWESFAAQCGLEMNEHGFDVSNSTARIADYVSKHGHQPNWREADELTKWHKKLAGTDEKEGFTPWQLLELASQGHETWCQCGEPGCELSKWAIEMFRQYALVFFGKKQLHWSKGLKKRFGIEEKTDEEIISEESEQASLQYVVDAPADEFNQKVVAVNARPQYLELCEVGGKEAIVAAIFEVFDMRVLVHEVTDEERDMMFEDAVEKRLKRSA